MSELFGVSTDYLLKDDVEEIITIEEKVSESEPPVKIVSMEEANEFITNKKKTAPLIANGVTLSITSVIVLLLCAGISETFGVISENIAAAIGLCFLFVQIALAVFLFIKSASKNEKYDYLLKEPFETEYGVSGMVKDAIEKYKEKKSFCMTLGIMLCILSVLPVVIAGVAEANDFVMISMVCVLLITVAVAVNIMTRVSTIDNAYKLLLQEGEYSIENRKENEKRDNISQIYWLIVTAIFLITSFISNKYQYTGLIWPVAGVLYGVVCAIVRIRSNGRQN